MRLNQKQKEAVEATEGRVLVLAGAGSGKTSVLISRIAHLIEKGVAPESIMGLTFTNKAAREMRERLARFVPKAAAEKVTLLTFHSFCFHLLKQEIHNLGYTKNFSIYDERDMQRLTAESDEVAEVMRAYNAVDFDSMITLTLQLFEEHPDVLERCQKQFHYIMIDEYQDTNPTQYKLATMLSGGGGNLCVVGDDDQSIYGWRGAQVKHILEFEHDVAIKLEQNYRSTPNILKGANAVIANNRERHDKELWSKADPGDPIHLFHAPSDELEAEAVVQRMLMLRREKGLEWGDIAILYRSNLLSRIFEKILMKTSWQSDRGYVRGIPYQIVQGTEFYQRAEVKDLLAYLKVVMNPNDTEAMLRIINYPRRGISTETLDKLTQYQRRKKVSLWHVLQQIGHELFEGVTLSKQGAQSIHHFVDLIERAQMRFERDSLKDAAHWLMGAVGYKEAIIKEVKSEKAQQFKWENIKQCLDMMEDENLDDFLSSSMLDPNRIPKGARRKDAVQLMTFHSSKGLEFPACFLVCLEDHILPHEKSLQETGVEEERRLLYVAMTRAKKYLTLSMAQKRPYRGKEQKTTPSRFLYEIPKELIKVSAYNFPAPFQH